MVDPQVQSVSSAIEATIQQRDIQSMAILGGAGALGVVGAREAMDRLDGRLGITADPSSARDHAINGVAKLALAGVVVTAIVRSGMSGMVQALAAIFAFGWFVSAGGNLIDAVGRTRLQAPSQSGGASRSRSANRARKVQRASSGNRSNGTTTQSQSRPSPDSSLMASA